MANFIKIKLMHSGIGKSQRQKDTLRGLGIRRIHQERILKDSPAVRGMIQKVIHLVAFEECDSSEVKQKSKNSSVRILTQPNKKAE